MKEKIESLGINDADEAPGIQICQISSQPSRNKDGHVEYYVGLDTVFMGWLKTEDIEYQRKICDRLAHLLKISMEKHLGIEPQ